MIPLQFKSFALLIILFYPNFYLAQEHLIYNINGNKNLEEQIFINAINKNAAKSIEEIKSKISLEISSRGYYNFNILNFDLDTNFTKDALTYNLKIEEGELTYIGKIYIDSLSFADSLKLIDFFAFLEDEVFIPVLIENRIEESLEYLENNGFPFATIKIKSVVFDVNDENKNTADIYLELKKDLIRKIDKVIISGNIKTSERVIINAARLSQGELFSQKRIEEIPIQLNRLRFFKNVKTPNYVVNSKGEGILRIDIVEKNTNTFDGIIGYVPSSNDNESGYLTGFINISLRNIFGSGRGFAIRWKQENSLTQELELKYLEPWIFNQPFNLNFDFFQRKQDSSYVKRAVGGELEYLATENISASLLLETESIIPALNVSNQTVLNSTSLNSGIKLKLDYRDDVYSPQSGFYFASVYKYISKNIKNKNVENQILADNLEYHNYELDFGIFYSFIQNQVLAFGVHAKEIIGDYYDLSDFFQFGGTNTLRGYRENQFLGNRIIWSNLEYRFLLSQSSYLFAFFDSGYYLINESLINNVSRKSDYKNGYGFGISLDTALGIMRVSYAFAEGTSITDGLIHFGLLNDF